MSAAKTSLYITAQTINFKLYTFFGYWKKDSKYWAVRTLYDAYSAFVVFSSTLFTLLQIVDLKDSWAKTEDMSNNLSATATSIFSLNKVYVLRLRLERVEKLRQEFREFLNMPGIGTTEEDMEIFERNAKRYMNTCTIMYTLVCVTVFTWWCAPYFIGTLPVRQWFPFEFEKFGFAYYIIYLYQCVHMAYFAAVVISMDLIFCCFVFLVCAHFDVLHKNILDFGNEVTHESEQLKTRKQNRKKLGALVLHHQRILRATEEVDSIFRLTNLIHFIGVGLLISVTEYDAIQKTAVLNAQFLWQFGNLGSACFDLFIYSYYGTLLQEKSAHISFAAYECPWYDMEPSFQKMMILLMLRGKKGAKITAGKLFPMSLETYLAVLRISYNLLAVLRQAT